ncbi:Non-classical phosphatidylinositol transfer protein (PITP) [Knufia peltigerae]|uniref:Phosphatidylinositol transfer protein SFH5 n=1 Tax=Knufia peltigerae TaxID=1002370 RepID=A0AA38YFD0_9EURO|nr:Non-classical phosphatidylinositol transfer protein (PITP) [Knufia peltigerae]
MASADTSAAPNSTTLPGEVSGIVPEVSLEKDKTATAITDAQNSTTLPGEVSGVVPDGGEKAKATTTNDASNDNDNVEQTTTDAPNNTSLPGEVSGVVPDTAAEKKDAATPTVKKVTPIQELWALAQSIGHPEVWGVTLADPETHVPTQVVLQKYLNANDGDLTKAKDQLTKTLEWRAKMKPLELMKKKFDRAKFEGLGYVTTFGPEGAEPEAKEIFTWNIYGSVKNIEQTFGNLEEFLEWRVVLMEEALQSLNIGKAIKPITSEHDPYKIVQVHDYKSISFLRQSPVVKTASTETIKVFAQNYPELLKEKFFVNVPAFMGFIYAFMKLFVAQKTIKKFHPMSNGANLARELATSSKVKNLADELPKEYGGKGQDLSVFGRQTALEDAEAKA